MTLKEFCEKHKDDYIVVRYPNDYNYIVDVKIRNLVITNNL